MFILSDFRTRKKKEKLSREGGTRAGEERRKRKREKEKKEEGVGNCSVAAEAKKQNKKRKNGGKWEGGRYCTAGGAIFVSPAFFGDFSFLVFFFFI